MMEEYCNDIDPKSLFCHDLPSLPDPGMGKILVTGASGYIGGRLVPELIARGYDVRVMVRAHSPEYSKQWPECEVVVADALKFESVTRYNDGACSRAITLAPQDGIILLRGSHRAYLPLLLRD